MKKMILSLVAAIVAATATYAQSSMLATLSHDGEISTYYGSSALQYAYYAAANGDVITLSGGLFYAVNLSKAVTIRGAGMELNPTNQTEPTVIAGDFSINIPDTITKRLTLEGIYHNHKVTLVGNLKNITFLKDRFNEITTSNNTFVTNLTMIHCRVLRLSYSGSSLSCVNCVIRNPSLYNNANIDYTNCVVIKDNRFIDYLCYSQFKNCILVAKTSSGNNLTSDCIAYNCVAMGSNASSMFMNIPNKTNAVESYTEIFKTFTGTYNDNENFELTDAAKTAYLGIDGTQIGIYGGNLPFSTTPTNPQITKCNVAAKSTADGKLSVDITVNGAE